MISYVGRRGKRIPPNRKPRICPVCGSEMVKSGIGGARKRQEWKCREHGHRTQFPVIEK